MLTSGTALAHEPTNNPLNIKVFFHLTSQYDPGLQNNLPTAPVAAKI